MIGVITLTLSGSPVRWQGRHVTHQGQSWTGTFFLRHQGPHEHQQNKESRRAGERGSGGAGEQGSRGAGEQGISSCVGTAAGTQQQSVSFSCFIQIIYLKNRWGYHGCLYWFLGSDKYTFPCHAVFSSQMVWRASFWTWYSWSAFLFLISSVLTLSHHPSRVAGYSTPPLLGCHNFTTNQRLLGYWKMRDVPLIISLDCHCSLPHFPIPQGPPKARKVSFQTSYRPWEPGNTGNPRASTHLICTLSLFPSPSRYCHRAVLGPTGDLTAPSLGNCLLSLHWYRISTFHPTEILELITKGIGSYLVWSRAEPKDEAILQWTLSLISLVRKSVTTMVKFLYSL